MGQVTRCRRCAVRGHTTMAFNRVLPYLCVACEIVLAVSTRSCDRIQHPLELGTWDKDLVYLDSAVIDNQPVYAKEGQIYVYENSFPGYTIQYAHVDNLAIKSCGATASLKQGGIGESTLLVVLQAQPGHEIRSVIDVWGVKVPTHTHIHSDHAPKLDVVNSRRLFENVRAFGHNNRQD